METKQRPVLKVTNSLIANGKKKLQFHPIKGNTVKMYTCGPTVYDSAHLGHARCYVTFDIVRRILQDYFHYNVFFVMNMTDVDDKIISRARQNFLYQEYMKSTPSNESQVSKSRLGYQILLSRYKNRCQELQEMSATLDELHEEEEKLDDLQRQISKFEAHPILDSEWIQEALDTDCGSSFDNNIFTAHAQKYEKEYFEDMARLNVREPDALTRVSEYVEEIKGFIKSIIDKGVAYESNGSVYFSITEFRKQGNTYGKLSKHTPIESNNEFKGEKKSLEDFALWKKSKPGEMKWNSEWGYGRPGWHIECSCMASDMLGDNIDVHMGGSDLKFPHHTNELAQSEAAHGNKQWVNYFWHAGTLTIKARKMGKSLKNFITIRAALSKNTARQIRLWFLQSSWKGTLSYSEEALTQAQSLEKTLKEFFLDNKAAIRNGHCGVQKWDSTDREFHNYFLSTYDAVHNALLDNFDYPTAMTHINALVCLTNKYKNSLSFKALLLKKVDQYVEKMLRIFGVCFNTVDTVDDEKTGKILDALAQFRSDVRTIAKEKKYDTILALSDHLRDKVLPNLGIRLEDKK